MPSGGDSLPVTNQLKAPDAVCLIRLSAIGDCCHTLPVVRTLQAAWPRTRITWIIGRTEFGLLEGASGIEFITFDKRTPWASLASIRRQLAGADPAKVIDVLTGRFGSGWLPAGREDIDQLVETASRLRAADASRLS